MKLICFALLMSAAAFGADQAQWAPGKIIDSSVRGAERDIVSLVEAMPADKFNFAPTGGEFKTVRTFSQQARHIAYVLYAVSSALLGEKNPSTTDKEENGPDLKAKDEVVKYVKDAFAYAHKAVLTLTPENLSGMGDNPFGESGKMPKLALANIAAWHSFDHYGQMVVYARMNGVVPPASKQ